MKACTIPKSLVSRPIIVLYVEGLGTSLREIFGVCEYSDTLTLKEVCIRY